jgi:hypothetical protein
MDFDPGTALSELDSRGLLPPKVHAAFLCGSLARGWANAKSDADVYLVVPEPWVSATANGIHVPLDPGIVPLETIYVGARQWEVKYWVESQLEQILAKVAWPEFDRDRTEQRVTKTEQDLLARTLSCVPITGHDWIGRFQRRIRESAYEATLVGEILEDGELMVEDAVGQAEAGDLESAVLSARLAFSCAVDALVAVNGQHDRTGKWRARRMRAAAPAELSFDRYWQVELMRELDPAAPLPWIDEVVGLCRELLTAVAKQVRRRPAA